MTMRSVFLVVALVGVLSGVALTGAGPRTRPGNTVSIKVSHETAAPGGVTQLKIRMTDAKPIITGRARLSLSGLASVEGISLVSPGDDAAGVAVVRGTEIVLSVASPNGTFGMDSDYPRVTVVARVPADAFLGQTFPILLHPDAFQLVGPAGASYTADIEQGQLVSWPSLTVHDVVPGSATLSAGSVVAIHGSHFHPDTEIELGETESSVAHVQYVSSTRLDVILDDVTAMHGLEIKARNPDDARVTYFSYQRTSRWGKSDDPVLRDVVPLFRSRTSRDATLKLAGAAMGIALQNLAAHDAAVTVHLLTSAGVPVGVARITVPSNRFVVRELTEVFRTVPGGNLVVRLSSPTPVQVLGISVDSSGAATPRLPE
jgi:hypothetical protein